MRRRRADCGGGRRRSGRSPARHGRLRLALERPPTGYQFDSTFVITPGQASGRCRCRAPTSVSCRSRTVMYSKFVIDSVDRAAEPSIPRIASTIRIAAIATSSPARRPRTDPRPCTISNRCATRSTYFATAMRRREKLDQLGPLIDRAEALDRDRRAIIQAVEERKAARNAATQEVARRKKAKENADDARRPEPRARRRDQPPRGRARDIRVGSASGSCSRFRTSRSPKCPNGGEECNVIVREWGTPRIEPGLRPHWEIAEALGIIDLARGAKISGSGFVVFRGAGARLVRVAHEPVPRRAYATSTATRRSGSPVVVNRATMTGTAQLPKFEDDMYGLAGRGSVPHSHRRSARHESLSRRDARRRPSCRKASAPTRRASAAKPDARARTRAACSASTSSTRWSWCATATPETSASEHELLTKHATTLLERLGLPYRVKLLAAGDTGFASAKTYDLEAYAPGVGAWLEVSSCSTFTDFQARRANIRYRPAQGEKPRFVHTLNGVGPRVPAHHRVRSSSIISSPTAPSRCPTRCGRISAPTRSAEPCAAARRSSSSPLESRCSSGRTSSTRSALSWSFAERRSAPGACMPRCSRRWRIRHPIRRTRCSTFRATSPTRRCRSWSPTPTESSLPQ